MKPVIALIGRPNVGKSTLFNRLTNSRAALVADQPGLTRDRIYGTGEANGCSFIVIDTAGLVSGAAGIESLMVGQSYQAVAEANAVFFLVDGRAGLHPEDETIATQLRRLGKTIFLVVNKTEGLDADIICADFQQLGITPLVAISATRGDHISELLESALATFPQDQEPEADAERGIKVALVGRPNVGKSTLVNRMLGEERVLVFDEPGTTRDSIYIPFERDQQRYTLIDTAGVRRRRSVNEVIEKFSVVKTLQAIESADVVVLTLNARDSIADQDLHLAGLILESGRALVIAINKWDGMNPDERTHIKSELDRRFDFLSFAEQHFISALHGTGVGHLFPAIQKAFNAATRKIPTPELTRMLQDAVSSFPPPLVNGRRIKLRYAHQGGQRPPTIIIHGNQTDAVPGSYKRYLSNYFRQALDLPGTPVNIEFRTGSNPYKGKRNELTPRQARKRTRVRGLKR